MRVSVRIHSTITDLAPDDREETDGKRDYTAVSHGIFSQNDGECLLSYSEDGENGKTHTRIRLPDDGGFVRIERTGAVNNRMTLIPGKEDMSVYEIPPFRFSLTAVPEHIENGITRSGGILRLSYRICLGGQKSHVALALTVTPAEGEEKP